MNVYGLTNWLNWSQLSTNKYRPEHLSKTLPKMNLVKNTIVYIEHELLNHYLRFPGNKIKKQY